MSKNQFLEFPCNYYLYNKISYIKCSFLVFIILALPLFSVSVFLGHIHHFFFGGGGLNPFSLVAPPSLLVHAILAFTRCDISCMLQAVTANRIV